jgi:hypothetical protein
MDSQAIIEKLISLSDLSPIHQFAMMNFDMLISYAISMLILGIGIWIAFRNTLTVLILSLSALASGVFAFSALESYNSSLNQRQIEFLRNIDNASIQEVINTHNSQEIKLKDIYHTFERTGSDNSKQAG